MYGVDMHVVKVRSIYFINVWFLPWCGLVPSGCPCCGVDCLVDHTSEVPPFCKLPPKSASPAMCPTLWLSTCIFPYPSTFCFCVSFIWQLLFALKQRWAKVWAHLCLRALLWLQCWCRAVSTGISHLGQHIASSHTLQLPVSKHILLIHKVKKKEKLT